MKILMVLIMSGLLTSCATPNYNSFKPDSQYQLLDSSLACTKPTNVSNNIDCSALDLADDDSEYRWKQDYKSLTSYTWKAELFRLMVEIIAHSLLMSY